MEIMIIGCGKVGQTLIQQLSDEGNNITAVDISEDKIRDVSRKYDVMGIVGNGATYMTQLEAGIRSSDLMIAVTAPLPVSGIRNTVRKLPICRRNWDSPW